MWVLFFHFEKKLVNLPNESLVNIWWAKMCCWRQIVINLKEYKSDNCFKCVWVKNLRDESFNTSRSFDSKLELSYWVSFAILDEPKYLITLYICWCSFKQTDIVDVSNLNRMSYWWSKHWIYDILQQLQFMARMYKYHKVSFYQLRLIL